MDSHFPEVGASFDPSQALPGKDFGVVPAVSPGMRSIEQAIRQLAESEVPVLILAEAGAGKGVVAHSIHILSSRRNQPLVRIDCATLKPEVLEGGLDSLFRWGTAVLDEVTALTPECQVSLLRALSRVEGNGHGARARLIMVSSRDLDEEVRGGRFLEELYYRISAVCLRLPPLRQRKEDIPLLMEHFLLKYAAEFGRPVPKLSAEARQLFQEYGWPGNVTELQEAAKAIVVLGEAGLALGRLRPSSLRRDRELASPHVSLKQAAKAASREAEKELILKVLNRTRWNRRRAAEELQISYKALLYKLKQIGVEEYGTS